MKTAAVNDYLSGKYSQNEIIKKYGISSRGVLQKLKGTKRKGRYSMTKGRKNTWKERIQIVQDALADEKDYQETAENHQVSYQHVYQWVHKYEEGGSDALKDRRGRSKRVEELTSEEKMK